MSSPVLLSRMLSGPISSRFYQRSLKLLCTQLEQDHELNNLEIKLNDKITLENGKVIQIDRKIIKKKFKKKNGSTQIKFDVISAHENATSFFEETTHTFYLRKEKLVIKPRQLLNPKITNKNRIDQHIQMWHSLHFTPQKNQYKRNITSPTIIPVLEPVENFNLLVIPPQEEKRVENPEEIQIETLEEKQKEIQIEKLHRKRYRYEIATPHTEEIESIQIKKPRGRLLSHLLSSKLSSKEKLALFTALVDEVESLQVMGIRHLNLEPGNIIYDTVTHRVMLLSYTYAQDHDTPINPPGLSCYTPPEFHNQGNQPHLKSDNFTLGILLARLMGVQPSEIIKLQANPERFLDQLLALMSERTEKDNILKMAKELIARGLLQMAPDKRLELSEVKKQLLILQARNNKSLIHAITPTLVKTSIFRAKIENNSFDLKILVCKKLENIFALPWYKDGAFAHIPPSIKGLQNILRNNNMSTEQKLNEIRRICKSANSMWNGRMARELIKLLNQVDQIPLYQLIFKLDNFITEFNKRHKVQNERYSSSNLSPIGDSHFRI